MAAFKTITAANSEFVLLCPAAFAGPQFLQQYATDDAFDTEDVTPVETKQGVDGFMASGFTPFLTKMTVHLMADSDSIDTFDQIFAVMKSQREVVRLDASIWLPATGKVYTCTNGRLTKWKPLPDAKKLLDPQNAELTWESVDPSNA